MNPSTPPTTPPRYERTSSILARNLRSFQGDETNVGILLYKLRRRSFGGVLFILAALSILPGVGIFSGVFMMLLGLQLCLGFGSPRLFRYVSKQTIRINHITYLLDRVIPLIERVEQYIRPRWLFCVGLPLNFIIGLITIVLAFLIIVPLPFTNLLPVLSMCTLSIGLMEKDGVCILIGLAISLLAFWISGSVIFFSVKAATLFL